MLSVHNTIKKLCLKLKQTKLIKPSKKQLEWWLCDSCSDTHLVSQAYVKCHDLHINCTQCITIGTAGRASFVTDGIVEVLVQMHDVHSKEHTLMLDMHMCNIGNKCLLNTAALMHKGWFFMLCANDNRSDSSFMVALDGVVFPIGQDPHGMPVLLTEGAPIDMEAKPLLLHKVAK